MELPSAERTLFQATYTPIRLRNPDIQQQGRAFEKWSLLAALSPTALELSDLKRSIQAEGSVPPSRSIDPESLLKAIETLGAAVFGFGNRNALRGPQLLAQTDWDTVVAIAETLVTTRQKNLAAALDEQQQLLSEYNHVEAGGRVRQDDGAAETGTTPAAKRLGVLEGSLGEASAPGTYQQFTESDTVDEPTRPGELGDTTSRTPLDITRQEGVAGPARIAPARPAPGVHALLAFARQEGIDLVALPKAVAMVYETRPLARTISADRFATLASSTVEAQAAAILGFKQRMAVEPMGFLHLERLGFTPAGIEQGELLHSVPLSPAEEVNLSHKEWSNTSEEFSKLVTDFLEQYSEEGVAEKAELTQSTNTENVHSSGLNTGVTASGSYGPVSVTAAVGYNVADSTTRSEQFARTQSATVTRKASKRAKQEHKISFKVASASGTEDQAVRRFTNPFSDKATRVDFYQLLRKWKVDLFRYGIRLTYDITIPEPGLGILTKILELQQIVATLQEGFGDPKATLAWAQFPLTPDTLTRTNYASEAAKYGAAVEPPPAEVTSLSKTDAHQWATLDQTDNAGSFSLEIDVDKSYTVKAQSNTFQYWEWPGHVYDAGRDTRLLSAPSDLVGKSGRLSVAYQARWVSSVSLQVQLELALRDDEFRAWQLKAWAAIKDAAQARYYENRQSLRERLDQLGAELGDDPLSLRKIEREEIMKGVLRWLFGPGFYFSAPGVPADPYDPSTGAVFDPQIWADVLAQGEVIKFLHEAVEWENMLYLLYPYFWSNPERWEEKKYLEHPDPLHRVFLKAGAARVVLTIRPGFELDFMTLVETAGGGPLSGSHPYVTIAQEMEDFAKTNYPGVRPANPVEDARPLLTRKQRAAWDDIQAIERLLDIYFKKTGSYPSTGQSLKALGPYTDPITPTVPQRDPWGNNYVYVSPGEYAEYDVVSLGANGKVGGTGEDSDITSWAEASLIGTWFEYTPTSAMSIKFDAILPDA